MKWLIENGFVIAGCTALLIAAGTALFKFAGLPAKMQIAKIKEWMLYAVTVAEKELGSGTGQIKLRMVFNMFVDKFPFTAKLVSFETFSQWVDDALSKMKTML